MGRRVGRTGKRRGQFKGARDQIDPFDVVQVARRAIGPATVQPHRRVWLHKRQHVADGDGDGAVAGGRRGRPHRRVEFVQRSF